MEIKNTFMNHPFWTQFMSIKNEPPFVNDADKQKNLKLVIEGFYPISFYSLYRFARFAELTPHDEAKKTARFISETEAGMHPLLGEVPYKGVPHYQQINKMLASLNDDQAYDLPHPKKYSFFMDANNLKTSEIQALAYCNLIEHTAVWVIHYYQEFLAKWQAKYKIPNSKIFRVYLDEHNLTEGDEAEDQHINLLNKMNNPYNNEIGKEEYNNSLKHLNEAACRHFDFIYSKILTLTNKMKLSSEYQN